MNFESRLELLSKYLPVDSCTFLCAPEQALWDALLTEAWSIVEKSAYFTVLDIEDGDLTVITKTGTHYASQQDILAEVTGSDLFR